MDSTDTLSPEASGDSDVWPTAGPAKGLRIRLPIAIACLAVVALAGAAAGATLKKPSSNSTVQAGAIGGNRANGAAGTNGAPGAAAGRFGGPGGGVFGTISKVEGNTITVTQRDGTTATVVVPSGTTITKTVSGSASDLTTGTSIAVRGTTADGKTTAESVTINPANGAFPAGGVGAPRQNTTGTTN